jgi:hypothetical protein
MQEQSSFHASRVTWRGSQVAVPQVRRVGEADLSIQDTPLHSDSSSSVLHNEAVEKVLENGIQ